MCLVVRPFVVVFVLIASVAPGTLSAAAQESTAASLPANIQVSPHLQPSIDRLLQRSDTFVAQCRRIAAARHVRISIVVTGVPRSTLEGRARSQITRHVFGALRAVVEIPVNGDYAELIGHELEHVIELIEGIDLPRRAREGAADVVEVQSGVYETARAKAAGQTIADESRGDDDPVYAAASKGVACRDAGPAHAGLASGPDIVVEALSPAAQFRSAQASAGGPQVHKDG